LIDATQAITHLNQTLSEITDNATCSSNHSLVRYTGDFTTYFHGVEGTATIIDDCTIQINNFSYDGSGPEVYFYAALDLDFNSSEAFKIGAKLSGNNYNSSSITLKLPYGKTLDDLNSLSVWCVEFLANFGDLTFSSP